ncbi:MAG: isoprenylcysteine carboxylmethyltransferase family protein [Maribacter sp.]|nr:isoprenylcysteine carboxylmethyltransferase family protein [Maribacter sp.]
MFIKFIFIALAYLVFAYYVFRVFVRRDYKIHKKLSPTSYILETLVFAVHANMFYLNIPTKWPYIPAIPENLELRIISAMIFGIGIIILLVAWFTLGTKPSFGIDKNKLRIDGVYGFTRNPQLLGYGLILVSISILFNSWLTPIWLLLYLITSYFMIQSEEEFLEQKYKEDYKEYCKRVPRIFGF